MDVRSDRTNGSTRAVAGAPGGLDGESVERLVLAHQGPLRAFLRYLGCPSGVVDDLVQETFLTFLSAEFEVRDERSTARYLRTIARHLFLKSLRRLDRDPPQLDLEAADDVWAEFQEDAGGVPYLDALRRCLHGVQGRARVALDLRYSDNLGRAAIARQLKITESGVHSILVRARRRLRECVERRLRA
ncbi:MAG: sigma-70 family RNA polymerase sigma factor [Planctomycetota bacterium]